MGMRIPNIFDLQRKRVQQQQTGQSQEEMDALKRRLASLGGLDQGAALKIQQQAEEKAGQRLQGALSEVDIQEQQYQTQQDLAEKERQFQAQEAEKQRAFAGGESLAERAARERLAASELASREKLAGQDIASRSQLAGQELMSREKLAGMDIASKEKLMGFDVASRERLAGLDIGSRERIVDRQLEAQNRAADLDATLKREGILSNEKLNNLDRASRDKFAQLQLDYTSAKDAADRDIVKQQMKNEVIFSAMTQSINLAQMAKAGLAPSEVSAMMNSFIGGAIDIDPNGNVKFNKNWSPVGVMIAGNPQATITTSNQGLQTNPYTQPIAMTPGLVPKTNSMANLIY